jgi:hypothetical protein
MPSRLWNTACRVTRDSEDPIGSPRDFAGKCHRARRSSLCLYLPEMNGGRQDSNLRLPACESEQGLSLDLQITDGP